MATQRGAKESGGELMLGGVALSRIARDSAYGTPSYVYDVDAIAAEARELRAAFDGHPHLVAYAVKANSAGPIVRALAGEGCGADVVSGAELLVALGCGIDPERIVYSGVAKSDDEIDRALSCGPRGISAIQAPCSSFARSSAVGDGSSSATTASPAARSARTYQESGRW